MLPSASAKFKATQKPRRNAVKIEDTEMEKL